MQAGKLAALKTEVMKRLGKNKPRNAQCTGITFSSGILYDCWYLTGLIFMHPGYKITEISSHYRNPKLGEVKNDFHLYLRLLYLAFNKGVK
jgi:hypothetical protein